MALTLVVSSHVCRWCRRSFKINISLTREVVSVSSSLKILTMTRKGGRALRSILIEPSPPDGPSHLKDQTKRYRIEDSLAGFVESVMTSSLLIEVFNHDIHFAFMLLATSYQHRYTSYRQDCIECQYFCYLLNLFQVCAGDGN